MLKHISGSLKNTKKYQLWQEAYWLVLVNQALDTFAKQHLQLKNPEIRAFVRLQGQVLHIKIAAKEPTVLAALKIAQKALLNFLHQNLPQKAQLVTQLKISFLVK
jgi:hypothetical protein